MNTEKIVLMKCKNCGYEEDVPLWILEELYEFSSTSPKTHEMMCPKCESTMIEKHNEVKNNKK